MARSKKQAECHPDRNHCAKGLCEQCYTREKMRSLRKTSVAIISREKERSRDPSERERLRIASLAYYHKNRERIIEKLRKRNADPSIKRRHKQLREEGKDRLREISKVWKAKNVEKIRAARQRRRARLKDGASPGVPAEVFLKKCEESEGRCWYCLAKCNELQREHVVPIARGGRDEPGNVVPACPSCNMSKNARLLSEWIGCPLHLLQRGVII
jgi:5-methylcytosine-specific restriction endonuclease McrA